MDKLVLVDGNAILHRAYHALPPLTTKKGEPINAVYGLVSMLLKVIQDIKPSHIVVCFDEKGPTFRHKEFAGYQAQRPKTDNELIGQFAKARKTVEAFRIPIYSKEGFEADDVIGTLSKQARQEVVIISGDRDILQLVDGRVKMFMPVAGLSSGKMMDTEDVVEKMGVMPVLIIDYKALVGDPSDNYSGVAGIGPKTAIGLLERFGNLDGIYKNLDKISPSVREKLQKEKKNAYLSYRLATIVRNVPIKLDIVKASKWDVDSPEAIKLFQEFGFKTLTDRVKKVGEDLDNEKQLKLI